MVDLQSDFDGLVRVAEAHFRAKPWTPEELALEQVLNEARAADFDFAEAAVTVAWSKLAPPDLQWNSRGVEG